MKKKVSRILAMILAVVMCMCSTVTVFATENVETNTDNGVAPASLEVLMSTTMTGIEKNGYFYVPETKLLGNTYYITFSGDSSVAVDYTIYNSINVPIKSGTYYADGTTHSVYLNIPVGEYRIAMSKGSFTEILCVISYNR